MIWIFFFVAISLFGGFWLLLHHLREETRMRARVEAVREMLEKNDKIKEAQLDVAARRPDDLNTLINRMRNDKL